MARVFDLHCHSNCSDGELGVGELIDRACSCRVEVLALTDHDTVQGIDQALGHAAGRLVLVPGIEVSVTWEGEQIHVVGLFVDHLHAGLLELVAAQRARRRERAEAIGRRLAKLGIEQAYERTLEMSGPQAIITRGNYARFLHGIGAAGSVDRAFNRFLRRGCPAYVKTQWTDLEQCVRTLHAAAGLAVIAHPRRYKITAARLNHLLRDFKACGGDGLEVSMCAQPPDERPYLAALAGRYGLYASAGSDFHRPGTPRELGRGLELPDTVQPIWGHPLALAWLSGHPA